MYYIYYISCDFLLIGNFEFSLNPPYIVLYLVQPLQLFSRPWSTIVADQLGSVTVGHVALEPLLALEEDFALVAPEQAHVVNLPTKCRR